MPRAEWLKSGIDSPWWPVFKRHLRHTVLYQVLGVGAACAILAGMNWNRWSKEPAEVVTNVGVGSSVAFLIAMTAIGFVFLHEWRQREMAKQVGRARAYCFRLRLVLSGLKLSEAPAIGWFEDGLLWLRSTDVGFELAPGDIVASPVSERQTWDEPKLGLSSEHSGISVSLLQVGSLDNSLEAPVVSFEREFRGFMAGEKDPGRPRSSPPVEPPVDRQVKLAMENYRDPVLALLSLPVIVACALIPPDNRALKVALSVVLASLVFWIVVRSYRLARKARARILSSSISG